ncbi:RNA polymerase sigma factor [Pedobacter metabolipauper]|uniref:RNA polymerase sigma-70 factor (ECF subfamily) n=1 Tax=Pedobacter metabolipauper TaxID=425513 RepID=A0A4R6SZH9_9SPHI|nr:RNA polymerase sigma-70 factor [Pedobacter metabolipauper]TDQ11492.1 RNA polymerase sigma-70 factor (ECF subfamily) [Pedobacter metabolipauper]
MSSELAIDAVLLNQLRNGDKVAFRRLYDQHYRKIYQFAKSFLKNKEQSEDILQETFLTLWAKRESLNIDLPIEPLLFTICRRLVIDAFRKATSSEKYRSNLLMTMNDADTNSEDRIIYADLLRVTEGAISHLPVQQQKVFRLNRFEGLSYDEIGEHLNISKNTVKNHLVVALKTLKSELNREGILYMLFITLFI